MDVTAVVPCYNAARFLGHALDSIARQTRPVRALVVVDDGSTDGSAELAEAWARRQPAMEARILRQANAGVSAARNAGWRAAPTEWIAFLDADDLWLPWHNEALAAAAAAQAGCSLAFGDAERFEETADGARKPLPSMFEQTGVAGLVAAAAEEGCVTAGGALHRRLLTGSFIATCSSLASRAALQAAGGFDERRAFGEDRKLWLALLAEGPVAATARPVASVRYHEANATHARNLLAALRANLALADELLRDPQSFALGKTELDLVERHRAQLLEHLRYALSRAGLPAMIKEKRALSEAGGGSFTPRDWLRGALRSVAPFRPGRMRARP